MFNLVTGLINGLSALVFCFVYQPQGRATDAILNDTNKFYAKPIYDPNFRSEAVVLSWVFGVIAAVLLVCACIDLYRYMRRVH